MDLQAVLRVIDFFFPLEVISAVLLIFAMENVLDYYIQLYLGDGATGLAWLVVYLVGVTLVSLLNYIQADEAERNELEDDWDDITDDAR